MNRTRALFTFLVFILFCVTGAYAQQTGALTGTVKDGTGAVIPNVNVTATNSGTQQARTVSSNSAGDYSIPFLTPGIYEVRAQGTGFKASVHPNIEIQVGGVQRVDFNMELGAVSEQVEVTSAEPLLSTESVALGSVVGTKQIVQLPLNGRDYLSLVQLSPNVVTEAASTAASSYQGGVRSAESISIAGQRLEFNHYTLDGVENTDPNFNSYIIHPSVDALQEFKVQTGVYSAEFGRGAAQINATTLSGTNKYHFVAFEFVRSSIFDADQWRQIGRKDPFHRNDAGFTLDGPLTIPKLFNGKDKLFFMSNFEILRDRLTEQVTSSVPTLAERQGDFSAPGLPAIYDPLTRVYTSNTTGTATQFSYNGVANVIPTNRISPAALALLNYEPLPNVVGASGYNYARQAAVPTDETQFNQRIDWTQNQRSSWFGRFGWETDLGTNAPANLTDTSYSNNVAHQVVIGNTFVVSPTMVNESRFAWSQFNNDLVGYFANNTNVHPQHSRPRRSLSRRLRSSHRRARRRSHRLRRRHSMGHARRSLPVDRQLLHREGQAFHESRRRHRTRSLQRNRHPQGHRRVRLRWQLHQQPRPARLRIYLRRLHGGISFAVLSGRAACQRSTPANHLRLVLPG
jgi:hypothetical protein